MLKKKREAQALIFDEPKNTLDLDAELQKLERIKQMRRSQMEEERERRNQAKLRELTKIYFQNEYALLKSKQERAPN